MIFYYHSGPGPPPHPRSDRHKILTGETNPSVSSFMYAVSTGFQNKNVNIDKLKALIEKKSKLKLK